MKHTAVKCSIFIATLFLATYSRAEILPSWNKSDARTNLIHFVESVSNEGSEDYVAPSKRIAVFDNDGTLWAEQPVYFQALFIFDRIRETADQHPEWRTQEPFASVLKGDLKAALAGGNKSLLTLTMATHANMSTETFSSVVRNWIDTAKHPETGMLYADMVYQPMLEVLDYLRENGFKTFIVSGGGIEFMRVFADEVYGVPPEQVIGSSIKTKFTVQDDEPRLLRLPEVNFIDDKEGKPVGINQYIGHRPIAAFGNSDGDLQMLQWTCLDEESNFCLIVHHTDAEREWAYDRDSHIGTLDKALVEADRHNWAVVDMKNDWKKIYP